MLSRAIMQCVRAHSKKQASLVIRDHPSSFVCVWLLAALNSQNKRAVDADLLLARLLLLLLN